MKTSKKGIDLIKSFEGCRLKAYRDSRGKLTIGYGATMHRSGKAVGEHDTITQHEAEDLFEWHLGLKETGVNALIGPHRITQGQFDALVSFAYNEGIGALAGSTLLKKIKKGDSTAVDEFAKWNKATIDGELVVVDGLTRRRAAEAALFSSHDGSRTGIGHAPV